MSEEGPKLYANKPKKAQLKQAHELKQSIKEASSPLSAAARSYTMGSPPPPQSNPPPPPPKESFARRYKFLWPLLLTVNLAVGAYLFMRTKGKDTSTKVEEVAKDVPSTPVSNAVATVTEKPANMPEKSVAKFVKPRDPIPEDEQRKLFKWILEEKRKIRPKDAEEKKQIDEEKALLKQFIRAKSIPQI